MELKKKGFTILELMVALALTGIVMTLAYQLFLSTQGSMFLRQAVKVERFKGARFIDKLSETLLACNGIVELSERSIRWENLSGKIKHLHYEDSVVYLDGDSVLYPVGEFSLIAYTPLAEPEDFFEREAEKSSLEFYDSDGNYFLDFDEMDLNANEVLEHSECKLIGLLSLNIAWLSRGKESVYSFTLHPRNRHAYFKSEE